MQMLATKQLIYTITCLLITVSSISNCFADNEFHNFFQVDPVIDQSIANRITSYYSENITIPMEDQKTQLFELENELEKIHDTHSNQAIYWFIKGLNHRNLASYYYEANKPRLADSQIYNKDIAYKKAIELDKLSSDNLSASIYSTMKFGLPQDLKIQAIQKELSLGGSGDSDSSYWYLHWSNIDQLKKAGRDKEAEQAYRKMQQEMKEDGADMSVYSALNKSIEQTTLNIKEKTPEPVKKKTENKKTNSPPKKISPEKPVDKKMIIISSILGFAFVSLLFLVFYEMRIKKTNNKKK